MMTENEPTVLSKLLWFVCLWAMSVTVLTIVGWIIRSALGL